VAINTTADGYWLSRELSGVRGITGYSLGEGQTLISEKIFLNIRSGDE